MEHDGHIKHATPGAPRGFNWISIVFLVVAAFFLLSEHLAHLMGALPFLLLLACLLMHLFMHHGHGAHGGHGERGGK